MFEQNLLCWTLDVSRTTPYKVTLVRLSICPSVSFLKIGSLVFSDIVHDDSWPWYLVIDGALDFWKKKKKWRLKFRQKWAKIGPETSFFCHFLKLRSLDFLEIAYNYNLKQCITSCIGKTHKINFGNQIWAKTGPESRFSTIFSVLGH